MKRIIIYLKFSFFLFFIFILTGIYAGNNIEVIQKNYIWKNGGPLKISIIKIKRGIYQPNIVVAPENEVMSLSQMAKKRQALAGINGGFFGRENNEILGVLAINGRIYAKKNVKWRWSILISHNGDISFKYIKPSNLTYTLAKEYRAILSAGNILIRKGRIVAKPSKKNPMSGIGISKKYIYLIVVDGRSLSSFGINELNFAKLFKKYKCRWALALDGGGSSELVIRRNRNYHILNHPSDNKERRIKTGLLFFDKNIVKVTLPAGFPAKIFYRLNRYYWNKNYLFSYNHNGNRIISLSMNSRECTINDMYDPDYSSTFYYKIKNARFILGNRKYLEFNLKIKRIKNIKGMISIYDGFDNFPLLIKKKEHYELTTSFETLMRNEKLSQFLIYNVFNDIIKKGEE